MRKEDKLILLLSRTTFSSEVREEVIKIMRNRISWEYVLSKSIELDLAPMFYHNLRAFEKSDPDVLKLVPESVVEELKRDYYLNSVRNMMVFQELSKILDFFNKCEVPVIVLKGAAVAELVYQNRALRPMVDIDILVKKEHLDSAEVILEELGYTPHEHAFSRDHYRDKHHHLIPYLSGNKLVQVEIHHHILPPSVPLSINISRMWERAEGASIAGKNTFVFSPEDMLLHFCLHLACSNTFIGKLRGLCDISEAVRKYKADLNWNQILEESKEYQIINYVYYPLWLAKEILDAEIPDDVLRHLEVNIKFNSIEDRVLKGIIKRYVLMAEQSGYFIPLGFIKLLSDKLLTDMKKINIFIILLGSVFSVIQSSARRSYLRSRLIAH